MMMQRQLLTFLCLILCADVVEAQWQRRFSIEATVGLSNARTEGAYERKSTALTEGVAGVRLKNRPGHSPLAALSTSMIYNFDDLSCSELPGGGCVPSLPSMSSRSVLIGWEALSADGASLRFLLGPAWFRSNLDDPQSGGHQARIDIGTPHFGWLAFVASFRWSHVASFRNGEIDYLNFGIGLRLR